MDAVSRVLSLREHTHNGFGSGVGMSLLAHCGLLLLSSTMIRLPADVRIEPTGTVWMIPIRQGVTEVASQGQREIVKPPAPSSSMTRDSVVRSEGRRAGAAAETSVAVGNLRDGNLAPQSALGAVQIGSPQGVGPEGDWYLATVQARLWSAWRSQLVVSATDVVLQFTIAATGEVTAVTLVQTSGNTAADLAARRALAGSAPFARLPAIHGQSVTVRAVFRCSGD